MEIRAAMEPGETVDVVPLSRLREVEAEVAQVTDDLVELRVELDAMEEERDAYRETLEQMRMHGNAWTAHWATAVLARYPKNETEQR